MRLTAPTQISVWQSNPAFPSRGTERTLCSPTLRPLITATTGRLNDECVPRVEFDRRTGGQLEKACVGFLDPIAAETTRHPPRHAKRRDSSVV